MVSGKCKLKVMRFHYTLTRKAQVKQVRTQNVEENVEHLKPSYTANENIKWYNYTGEMLSSFLKFN